MKTGIAVVGYKDLLANLDVASEKMDDILEEVIEIAAFETHAIAIDGIKRGAPSGRVYTRGGVSHKASSPGQYPAADSGGLDKSIYKEDISPTHKIVGNLGGLAPYGVALEFGTINMLARPWLMPSFERAISKVDDEIRERFARI